MVLSQSPSIVSFHLVRLLFDNVCELNRESPASSFYKIDVSIVVVDWACLDNINAMVVTLFLSQ